MFIDLDVLDKVRRRAKDRSLPYETFINQLLRDLVLGSGINEHIRKIVREEFVKKIWITKPRPRLATYRRFYIADLQFKFSNWALSQYGYSTPLRTATG